MNDSIEIGKRLHDKRKDKGLTMKELGILVGLSESNVQRYESGKIKNVSLITLKAFAVALNVEVEYLMGYSEPAVASNDKKDIKGFTVALIDRLLSEGIIEDKDNIPQEVIAAIVASLKLDLNNKKN